MKKTACLFFVLCFFANTNAQYKITCGTQIFNIKAKKLSPVKQVDEATKTVTTSTFYYLIDSSKLQVWLQIGDSKTTSFTLYEIEKVNIDQKASGEIAEYNQQDYTEPVKSLYIKCTSGEKDVKGINYVDWTENADKFSWSFININSYDKTELESTLAEIKIWLGVDTK
jgi:hypothetical protein